MSPLSAIIAATAAATAATAITVALIFLAFGHVSNDRNACLQLSHGAECGLRWEPLL